MWDDQTFISDDQELEANFENGGDKVVHGSGGMSPLRAA